VISKNFCDRFTNAHRGAGHHHDFSRNLHALQVV
jgi:hypothetical protein